LVIGHRPMNGLYIGIGLKKAISVDFSWKYWLMNTVTISFNTTVWEITEMSQQKMTEMPQRKKKPSLRQQKKSGLSGTSVLRSSEMSFRWPLFRPVRCTVWRGLPPVKICCSSVYRNTWQQCIEASAERSWVLVTKASRSAVHRNTIRESGWVILAYRCFAVILTGRIVPPLANVRQKVGRCKATVTHCRSAPQETAVKCCLKLQCPQTGCPNLCINWGVVNSFKR